ncbi:ABC transporter substrate-binding protein [Actinokineospora terrae]|uniref:Peptide/nickel transport system substrate-binding protein n=1 Tax=Actinokineospora terrae TaxID=155974 RepID=A0A1H9XL37_9PSEU|nr:ABC transporter substrate-binding protein [Actinokineospora terrae]SES46824.1 peptide/nickel transport system substrate-binding protein [Actinokineospora terrae]
MNSKRLVTAVAAGAAVVMGLSACGGGTSSSGGSTGGNGGTNTPAFNAAMTTIFNPSDKKGGTVRVANAGTWDSLDPGETYYGYSWNFARTYARTLVMFKPAPGDGSSELVPDLAESLGEASDGGKTWTYKIRKGVKFEDGSVVTSKDVKYAVLRSTDKETFPNGPAYFEGYLNLPEGYKGPYKSKGVDTNSAIETPDDQTIVFHLKQPFGGFDYFAMMPQTAPVPEAKDTGAKYKEHVIATGPYKFDKNEIDKGFTLVRNDQWDAATDPNRKALPDGYQVTMNVNADDIDNRVISGDLDLDITGTGVQPASLSRVLGDPALKAGADNPSSARLWYTSISPTVAPFDNKACREAVQYAVDRTGYQTAYGGTFSGGDIATNLLPPQIPGASKFDLYPAGADNKGDVEKAKAKLQECGQPNGFETNIAYRAERPKEKAAAEALQQSLGRVGIKLTLKAFPQGDYFSQFAGNPPYVVANKLGLALNGWQADWSDGFGFLSQIVDSRVIRETGGSSNVSVRVPDVDKMLDEAIGETDKSKRESDWGAIDKRVMEEAVILPGVHAKALLVRPKKLTNVFVSAAYGQYDYLSFGVA